MRRPPLLLAGLSLVGAIVLAWFVLLVPTHGGFGYDAFAFWDVRLDDILAWLGGRSALACCAFIGIPMSLYEGNVDLFIAASVVLGFRWPAAWSFAILTKVTPGVGLIWYVVRRDWRSLRIALGSTALIILVTLPFVHDAWPDYLRMLIDNGGASEGSDLVLRVVIAGTLVAWAARADRPWVVGLALAVAQPALALRSLSVGVAALALFRRAARPDAWKSPFMGPAPTGPR